MTSPKQPSETPRTAPHANAAFINALSEEGNREEILSMLQEVWNERCQLKRDLAALRGQLVEAQRPSLGATDADGNRWRKAVKDGEFPRRGAGGFWLHVDRISGVIHEYDTPEGVMDAAMATTDDGNDGKIANDFDSLAR